MNLRASSERLSRCSRLCWGLVAALCSGCLGGFTGDAGAADHGAGPVGTGGVGPGEPAEGNPPACGPVSRQYAEEGLWGLSAAELVEGWGGVREGTLDAADDGFLQALGVEGTSLPTSIHLGISYDGNPITEDTCTGTLTVGVAVSVELGDLAPLWQGAGQFVFGGSTSTLGAQLADTSGVGATNLRLEASPTATPVLATLTVMGTELARTATYRFD